LWGSASPSICSDVVHRQPTLDHRRASAPYRGAVERWRMHDRGRVWTGSVLAGVCGIACAVLIVQALVSAADELLVGAVPWTDSFEPVLRQRLSRDDAVRGALITAVFGAALVWLATAAMPGRRNAR